MEMPEILKEMLEMLGEEGTLAFFLDGITEITKDLLEEADESDAAGVAMVYGEYQITITKGDALHTPEPGTVFH
jgi:hypothetical protein